MNRIVTLLLLCLNSAVRGEILIGTINRSAASQDNGIEEMSPVVINDVINESFNNSLSVDSSSNIKKDRTLFNIYTQLRWKPRASGRVIVPYRLSSVFSNADRNLIRTSLNDLEARTGSINFISYTNQQNYVNVVRTSNSCSSFVGKIGGPQNLNLGPGCMDKGVIQHEFIHALGLSHEQTRPDRDTYVTIKVNNIRSKQIADVNFGKKNADTLGSPYDYRSVMHYGARDFSKNGKKTIVTKNGASIGQRDKASEIDIKKLKLLYQCERGQVRQWQNLEQAPCTATCMCKNGEAGCGSNSDACYGDLVCSNNRCIEGSAPTPAPTPPPPTTSTTSYIIYNRNPVDTEYYCFDLFGGSTANTNKVWYSRCNFSPAQYWYSDSNSYIRSSINKNKCLVGSQGSTQKGTTLMIYDCFENDSRFKWDYYTDASIRPRNNPKVCIEPETSGGGEKNLVLDGCFEGYKNFYFQSYSGTRRKLTPITEILSSEALPVEISEEPTFGYSDMTGSAMVMAAQADGEDSPMYWYDFMGRNCEWYGLDAVNYCTNYGNNYMNFGKTANSACNICGGGDRSAEQQDDVNLDNVLENEQGCWDKPDWYDSTGDGCSWYSEESNYCDDYGVQFASTNFETAKDACCNCGGGLNAAPAEKEVSTPKCSNLPFDWALYFDGESEGIDCSWYAENETNCGKFGNKKNYDGTKANEACCACGGGLNPSGTGTEGKECIDSDKLKYKGKKKYSCTWLANKNTKQIRKLCKTKAWEDIKLKDWCPETCGNAGVGKCK